MDTKISFRQEDINSFYGKKGTKIRKKKRNTIFRDLLALCLTVALVLVMPQPVYAAGSKPTSMTLNVSQKTIDMNSGPRSRKSTN